MDIGPGRRQLSCPTRAPREVRVAENVGVNMQKLLSERSKPDSTWEGPYEGVPGWIAQALSDWTATVVYPQTGIGGYLACISGVSHLAAASTRFRETRIAPHVTDRGYPQSTHLTLRRATVDLFRPTVLRWPRSRPAYGSMAMPMPPSITIFPSSPTHDVSRVASTVPTHQVSKDRPSS